jgi:PDZ domain-containing protein
VKTPWNSAASPPGARRGLSRRSWAALLALVLTIGLGGYAASRPVPYVTFAPGPTVNVLGTFEKKDIIEVSGRKTYEDKGGLRLVTVIPSGPDTKVSLAQLVWAWASPNDAVYPYEAVYAPQDTGTSVREQSGVQMVSSQDNAVAAALRALDIPYADVVKIAAVDKDGPAHGKLEAGDVVVSVNGRRTSTLDQLTGAVQPLPIGSTVTLRVKRDGKAVTQRITTVASPQDPKKSAIRVQIAPSYRFPFEVDLNIDQNIGGPSGGLMFALGIYDVLTPGSLTGGRVIAGTGEIDAAGKVGEIGGIQQKLVGAQEDGARLFLVPAGNCAEALGGHYDPDKMRLVKVRTLDEALEDVQSWVKDPDAKLARCTR